MTHSLYIQWNGCPISLFGIEHDLQIAGARSIDSIVFQSGSGILPLLRELVGIVTVAFINGQRAVIGTAVKYVTTLAKAVATFGGNAFADVIPVIWDGINGKERRQQDMI